MPVKKIGPGLAEVRLVSATGKLVCTAGILPVNPEVVAWGHRTFVAAGDGVYREALTVAVTEWIAREPPA